MRYLIIDTEKEINSACKYWISRLEQYGAILPKEESIALFKEVWDACKLREEEFFEELEFGIRAKAPDLDKYSESL